MLKFQVIAFYLCFMSARGFLWWSSGEKSSTEKKHDMPAQNGRVPFEMKTVDEKFVASAQQYLLELSELDLCHHKVISQVKSSCNDATEEEVSKLGVALLNCQSQVEGRPTYTCTEDMSIADCTSQMDSNTWNAYHIISNRVRAVCYSTRQQQFQYRTQNAVNQLAMTAEQQLYHVKLLQDSHEDLQQSTDNVIKSMANGQAELLWKQDKLKSKQNQLQNTIVDNLKVLQEEKALVAAGQKEYAEKTEYLRALLENTSTQLMIQGLDSKTNHEQLMEDLYHIRDKAAEIWQKIDDSSKDVMSYQTETAVYYQHTMDNLKKMNDTANHILMFLDSMQSGIDRKLGWITAVIGGTGDSVSVLMVIATHLLYFIVTCILVTFLQTPVFSRIILLILVPLNAVSEIKHQKSLDFMTLSGFVATVAFCNWVYLFLYSLIKRKESRTIHKRLPEPKSPCSCGFMSPWKPLTESNDDRVSSVVKETVSKEIQHYMEVLLDGESQQDEEDLMDENMDSTHISSSSIRGNNTTINNLLNLSALNSTLQDSISSRLRRGSVILSSTAMSPATPSNSFLATPMTTDPTPMPSYDAFSGTPSKTPDMVKRQLGQLMDDVSMETRERSSTPSSVVTNMSVNSTGTPRRPCQGITKSGLPCRRSAMKDGEYCASHLPN